MTTKKRCKPKDLLSDLNIDAVLAAAKAIDPLSFQPVTGPGPRGYEGSTPERLGRLMVLRQNNAIHTARKAICAYHDAISKLGDK